MRVVREQIRNNMAAPYNRDKPGSRTALYQHESARNTVLEYPLLTSGIVSLTAGTVIARSPYPVSTRSALLVPELWHCFHSPEGTMIEIFIILDVVPLILAELSSKSTPVTHTSRSATLNVMRARPWTSGDLPRMMLPSSKRRTR